MATRTVGTGQTYTTIQAALNALVAGDIVSIVTAGVYTEKLTLVTDGTSGSRVTIRNDSGGVVTVRSTISPVVELAGKDYYTFGSADVARTNFVFEYTGSQAGPRVFNNTHGTQIDGLQCINITRQISGGDTDGCVCNVADSDSTLMSGCADYVVSGAGASHDGMNLLFSSSLTVTNCSIAGLATNSMQDGIVASGTLITISGNTLANGQDLAAHPDGIVIQGDGDRDSNPTSEVAISGNFISDFDQCIYLDAISADMTAILVYNNLIRQTSGWTVSASIAGIVMDGDGDGSRKIEAGVYNNTIDVRGITIRNARMNANGTNNQKTIKNNLFVNPQFTALYLDVVSNVTLDNNLYDSAGDATVTNYGGVNKTFAQLQAVPQEAAGLRTAPALNANYTVPLASPAKGAGADLSGIFTTDITGATRTVPWDIGCYKAAASAASATPVFNRAGAAVGGGF